MTDRSDADGAILQWGDRLFYPGNRIVKGNPEPRLRLSDARRAALLRERIEATVVRRAPQVMVKVTGGGRGIKAIAAHFRYITKNGRLEIEDERGQRSFGRDGVRELLEDWRLGGTLIDDLSVRREAFNIMVSMPRGVDALFVERAAREFAKAELADHKYVMVLHDHQANPHVHISVRAESIHGRRLNPRKSDLQHWRETFAEKLRDQGIDAEATRRICRGVTRQYDPLWRLKASEDGRLRKKRANVRPSLDAKHAERQAADAWRRIATALGRSARPSDRSLAISIEQFLCVPKRWDVNTRAGPNKDAQMLAAPEH
jgi:hypothetical protein